MVTAHYFVERSGLSQAEFCRQANLPYRIFCYRCWRAEVSEHPENIFVPLAPAQLTKIFYNEASANFGKQSGVRLCLGGVQIELERGFCLTTLSALLSLLEGVVVHKPFTWAVSKSIFCIFSIGIYCPFAYVPDTRKRLHRPWTEIFII